MKRTIKLGSFEPMDLMLKGKVHINEQIIAVINYHGEEYTVVKNNDCGLYAIKHIEY